MRPASGRRAEFYKSPVYRDTLGRIASNVRRLRAGRGWTQVRASVACTLDLTVYQTVERGTRNVTTITLARLAEGFEVDVAAFLQPAPPPEPRKTGRPKKVPRPTPPRP